MSKKNIIKYLGLFFVGFVLSLLLLNAPEIGLCANCYSLADVGQPLVFLFLSLILIFFIFIFTNPQVFTTWKKFAIPYIAISALILIFASDSGGSWGVGSIIDDREGISIILSILFFVISLILIAVKSWRLRKMSA